MEIGLVYSSKNARHAQTRAFVKNFIKERGILAHLVETEKPVKNPTITINGCSIVSESTGPGKGKALSSGLPSQEEISRALERGFWCL